jgi:hypothetical protein
MSPSGLLANREVCAKYHSGGHARRVASPDAMAATEASRPHMPRDTSLNREVAADDVFRYVLQRADMIRQRAQYAAATAAIAAAAITAAMLAHLEKLEDVPKVAAVAAVVAWVLCLATWVYAIGLGLAPLEEHLTVDPPRVNVRAVIRQATCNATRLRHHLTIASWSTVAAAAVTATALGLAAVYSTSADNDRAADIWLTPSAARAVAIERGSALNERIHGKLVMSDLSSPSVKIKVDRWELRVRSDAVVAVAKR